VVEIPGKYTGAAVQLPDPIVLPEPRSLADYALAPCKHECNILKQRRHVGQAHKLLERMDPLKQALMRASACQCGLDSAHCSSATVEAVARMDCQASLSHDGISESTLFCAATLHRFGLPVDYAKLENCVLPEACQCCAVPLWDPGNLISRPIKICIWQCHMIGKMRRGWSPPPSARDSQAGYEEARPVQPHNNGVCYTIGLCAHRAPPLASRPIPSGRPICCGTWNAHKRSVFGDSLGRPRSRCSRSVREQFANTILSGSQSKF
jgi:hypothetical protein